MSAVVDVSEIFQRDEVPENVYAAVLQLAVAARDISMQHDLCTVCLIEAFAYITEDAIENGRLLHESETLQ